MTDRATRSRRLTILSVPLVAFPRVATLLLGTLLEESRDPLTRRHHQGAEQAATNVVRKWNPLERTLGGFAGMLGLTLAGILVIQVRLPLRGLVQRCWLRPLPPAAFAR